MKAFILDDEKHCRQVLETLLKKYCPEVVGIESHGDPLTALDAIKTFDPDVVFLDIEMPEMSGFEWLNQCEQQHFEVVFTTAYNEYAIKAIKHSALDYLLKPVDKDELIQAVEKVKREKHPQPEARIHQLLDELKIPKPTKRFAIPTLEGLTLINPDEILYVKSDGPYSHFIFTDKRKMVISKTLKEAEEVLPASDFFRIHNSYLVNMKYVQQYIRGEGGEVVLINGETIPVSRSRKQEFLGSLERI
ncbi:MAG TPA: LytTR family DNA-binding domain-containing protein [Phnomibacter sp.]|nr:LytTR family DNA-binding domain-containing protein [Phnomibacter sp.]